MADRAKVEDVLYGSIADLFNLKKEDVAKQPELRFREDLAAKSMEFFPMIADLEDSLGIQIEYHDFQSECRTVGMAVDYVCKLCDEQGK